MGDFESPIGEARRTGEGADRTGDDHATDRQRQGDRGANRRHADHLRAVLEILQYPAASLQAFLDHALDQAIALTGSTIGYIYFYDEDRREFVLNSWSKGVMRECTITEPQTCYELDKTGFWGEAVRQRRPIVLNDFAAHHPLKRGYPDGHVPLSRFLTVPVLQHDRIVAVVGVANKASNYDETDVLELSLLMGIVWTSVEALKGETALRERERYLAAILQTTADGFWVVDHQGRVTETNQAYCAMTGRPRESLLGLHIADLIADESPDDTAARTARIVQHGSEVFRTRHRRQDGSLFPIEVSATYLPEGDGQFIGFGRDLTERQQVEERLAVMARMLDDAPASITIHDAEGRFLYANQATFDLHGYDRAGFMALNLHQVDVPESASLIAERVRRINDLGEVRFEVSHYRRDGSTLPLDVLAKRIEWRGRPAVLSIAVDQSARQRADEALRLKSEELERFFNSSLDLLSIANVDGEFVRLNPEWERVLGYSIAELEGRRFLDFVHPDDLDRTLEAVSRLGEQEVVLNFENRYRCKDGGYRWIEWRAIPHGRLIYSAARDMTAHKRAEAERERLQAQLAEAQKMESIGRLAGGVAHDFNNMLGAILGHTEMALSDLDPSAPLYADLEEVRKAAQRSADLTRQLLAFARRQTVTPKVLDLNETVTGMLKMLRRLIGEGIDLVWMPGAKLGPVLIDPSQIDQILVNLCVNARDAIGETGTITLETRAVTFDGDACASCPDAVPGDYVALTIGDTGCGMDSDTRARLFEPFFTTKAVGQGTGLGLPTVYGIVKQNRGFITVDSEVGRGTRFRIFLPRHADRTEARATAEATVAAEPGHETVLLVEDEPAILKMTAAMLQRQGYTVLAAASPGEAIRLAREHAGEIHLLMTDVVMPEMNGRDLARNLLSLYPNLRRLFMSGYTADVIAHHGVLEPGIHFIQKPFSMGDLAARVRDALGG